MNERAFVTLKRNKELRRFLEDEARRHFGADEDLREDAVAEAWERIWKQPAGMRMEEYKRHGGNAISALYKRTRRRRKNMPQETLDADPEGNPSSAMAQLAQKAIDGDW